MNTFKPPHLRWALPPAMTAGALVCGLLGLGSADLAQAEWAQLEKTEQVTHFFDKDSVKVAHVTRYAWTLAELNASDSGTGSLKLPGIART